MNTRMIIMLSLVALAAIVIIQNMLLPAEVRILFIKITMPQLILGILLLFIGYVLGAFMRKK
jgi:hypothetical protein